MLRLIEIDASAEMLVGVFLNLQLLILLVAGSDDFGLMLLIFRSQSII